MCKLLFKKLSEVVLNYLTDLIRVWCICEKEVISITTEPVYEDPLRKQIENDRPMGHYKTGKWEFSFTSKVQNMKSQRNIPSSWYWDLNMISLRNTPYISLYGP